MAFVICSPCLQGVKPTGARRPPRNVPHVKNVGFCTPKIVLK